jgi:hypothetical protein
MFYLFKKQTNLVKVSFLDKGEIPNKFSMLTQALMNLTHQSALYVR